MEQRRSTLGPDFLWGVSTASYQIEGSTTADGRGKSIWDSFCEQPGRVKNGDSGEFACDSYRRWPEDIELLRELGVGAYRFSIAWPRVQPEGRGKPNQAGLDYYKRLADAVRAAGIEPWAALYHWDLPQTLEDSGGWPARDTALRFAEYAGLCFDALGASIRYWATFNEPWCSAFLGYASGEHAPGRRERAKAYAAAHHLLLAHGLALRSFREGGAKGSIGIVINPAKPRPATARAEDQAASERASVERTGLWLDPLFKGSYPEEHLRDHGVRMPIEPGDMALISALVDYVGVNYYNEDAVRAVPKSAAHPEGFAYVPTWQPKTAMGWDVEPEGLTRILKFMADGWPVKALYVTENGAAYEDIEDADGRIRDGQRIAYYQGHVAAIERAVAAGVPLKGYFAWTLMDNFEWAHGYDKRFGLVAVDRSTGNRVKKDSFYYYRDAVAGYRP
jgi:beta-glucosidase